MRAAALAGFVLVASLCLVPRWSTAAMMPFAQGDPAIWRWLPHGEDLFEPWRRRLTADASIGPAEMFDDRLFSRLRYPPILYDRAHGLVLYYQACCDWQETVLATVTTPPPRALIHADLAALKTPRGIALGAAPAAVRRAYGPALLHRSTTSPGLRVLSYYRSARVPGSACAWSENFVFRGDRLIEIQAGHGC
jgi:hypothetical protein